VNRWFVEMIAAWLLVFGVLCPVALLIEHWLGLW
jgi:hypothetical protein